MSIDSLTRAEKIRKHQEEMKLKNEQEAMNILLNKPADNIQQIEFFYDMDTPQSYKNSVDFVISKLNEKNVFECIHADKPTLLHFDFDYNQTEDFECYSIEVANEILRIVKHYISDYCTNKFNIAPEFVIKECHSNNKIKNGQKHWCYSFHIIVPNVYTNTIFEQSYIAREIEKIFIQDQKTNPLLSNIDYNLLMTDYIDFDYDTDLFV